MIWLVLVSGGEYPNLFSYGTDKELATDAFNRRHPAPGERVDLFVTEGRVVSRIDWKE
jgi:hypothetical protein